MIGLSMALRRSVHQLSCHYSLHCTGCLRVVEMLSVAYCTRCKGLSYVALRGQSHFGEVSVSSLAKCGKGLSVPVLALR